MLPLPVRRRCRPVSARIRRVRPARFARTWRGGNSSLATMSMGRRDRSAAMAAMSARVGNCPVATLPIRHGDRSAAIGRIRCAPVAVVRIPRRPGRIRQPAEPVGIAPRLERRRPWTARIAPRSVRRGPGAERPLPFSVGSDRVAGAPCFDIVAPLHATAHPAKRRPLVDVGTPLVGRIRRTIDGRLGGVLRHTLARLGVVTVG